MWNLRRMAGFRGVSNISDIIGYKYRSSFRGWGGGGAWPDGE